MMTIHDLEGKRSNFTLAKDLQTMISKKLFSHFKPLGPMIREMLGLFDMPPICHKICDMAAIFSVDSRNFKKWGRSPTTTQNVGEGLKILGDDFMISLN